MVSQLLVGKSYPLWGGSTHIVDAVAAGKRMCLTESSSGPL